MPHPLPACPPSVAALTNSYHYITVEVATTGVTLCPRHPDGSPVEACIHLPPHGNAPRHSSATSAAPASFGDFGDFGGFGSFGLIAPVTHR